MEYLNRRQFLETSIKWGEALLLGVLPLPYFPTQLPPNPPISETDQSPLERYLAEIETEKSRIISIAENYEGNLMEGIKSLSHELIISDLKMYTPMYLAAEKKYGVPWIIPWIIHTAETNVSLEPNDEYMGAMQIMPEHYDKLYMIEAPVDWEFLDELDQRWSKKLGYQTNDWEEILRAAAFIRIRADWGETPEADEAQILDVVHYRYSAEINGRARVAKYWELKRLFTPNNPGVF